MKESGVAGGCKCERIKNMDEIRTVFPKFDLGRVSSGRHFSSPPQKVYATIDRDGEQTARAIPSSFIPFERTVAMRRGFTANDL